jgi:isochorismate synthase
MDYIEESLFKNEISEYGRTGPYTVKAGNVVHLKTRYNLSLDQIKGKIGKLITDLHPTPAVCGLPRNKAYELIRKVEKYDRSFYTGFLGPWGLNSESRLFVNLRCAELKKEKLLLYIGGGLTAESDPEAEWEETIRKSQTLLSVLEKM